MKYLSKQRKATLLSIIAVASCAAMTVQAAGVSPPPRPPGFHVTEVVPGDSPVEKKRQVRAHHNKTHFKKDMTRDDRRDTPRARDNGKGSGNGRK